MVEGGEGYFVPLTEVPCMRRKFSLDPPLYICISNRSIQKAEKRQTYGICEGPEPWAADHGSHVSLVSMYIEQSLSLSSTDSMQQAHAQKCNSFLRYRNNICFTD